MVFGNYAKTTGRTGLMVTVVMMLVIPATTIPGRESDRFDAREMAATYDIGPPQDITKCETVKCQVGAILVRHGAAKKKPIRNNNLPIFIGKQLISKGTFALAKTCSAAQDPAPDRGLHSLCGVASITPQFGNRYDHATIV